MKKRFYVYYSWKEQMELLSTEEKATMLMNLFRFQENEEPILNTPMLKMCWASMKFLLEKDAITYQQKVDNMAKIGKRNNKVSNDTATISNDTIRYRLDNVNDNVNDNVKVNVKEIANDPDAWDKWMDE